jgi:hypothetical protein
LRLLRWINQQYPRECVKSEWAVDGDGHRVVPTSEETNQPRRRQLTMADERRIGLKELLRKAQIEGDAEFLKEVWKHLKCVEPKNLRCESLAELKIELRKAKERLRHKQDVILGCIRQPGFEV